MSIAVKPRRRWWRASARRLAGGAALVAVATMARPIVAAPMAFLSVAEYRDMARSALAGDFGAQQALTLFATGLLNMTAAFDDSARQAGAELSICLSADVPPVALLRAIDAELAARPAFWLERKDEDIGLAALAAMKQHWPCQ